MNQAHHERWQLHGCGGTGQQYYRQADYSAQADEAGAIVVYPTSIHDTNCWDSASNATLTHGGGGDSQGLANIAKYFIEKYNADPGRIFTTGSSSGGMISGTLMATYPDVFKGASIYSGFAAGCIAGSPGSNPSECNPQCLAGNLVHTGKEWADIARAMYPSYNGSYGPMLIWHGTSDFIVAYGNLAEELKQWSTLKDVSFAKNVTNSPSSGYTKMIYGDGTQLMGYSGRGVGHTVPVHPQVDFNFFGLL